MRFRFASRRWDGGGILATAEADSFLPSLLPKELQRLIKSSLCVGVSVDHVERVVAQTAGWGVAGV